MPIINRIADFHAEMTEWRPDEDRWQLSCTLQEQPLVNGVRPAVLYFSPTLFLGVETEGAGNDTRRPR